MSHQTDFRAGDLVGARRWPESAAHPDAWGKPHRGVVLDFDDPQAWEDTLAFPGRLPTVAETKAHVAALQKNGQFDYGRLPVDWEFGTVHWESVDGVRSYDEDVAEWKVERARARMIVAR